MSQTYEGQHWNILSVKSGTELVAHEILTDLGFEVYTPFETRRQLRRGLTRKEPKRHIHYAEPIVAGWLFIRFNGQNDMKNMLFRIMERRPFFYGALTTNGELYAYSDIRIQLYKETLTRLLNSDDSPYRRLMPRGYDPKLDSRKNKQRIYGQKEVKAAIFKAGETVEFIDGSWAGLKLEVTKQGDDMVDLEGMVFGRATKITAYPEDLQKSA